MANSKNKWFPYLLAFVFSACVLLFLFLLSKTGFAESLGSLLQHQSETLLPLPAEGTGEGELSLPFALLTEQGDAAFAAGNLQDAMRFYESALQMEGETGFTSSSDIPVMRKIFHIALLLRDRGKAEAMLGLLSFRGMAEEPLDALRGFLLLRMEDREGARALFAKYPESPEHAYGLTLLAILENAHEEAGALLAITRKSSDPLLVHAAQTLQGAYDEFALFEDGKETHRATLLSRSLAQVNECPVAEVLLEEVTAKEPDYRDAWIVLGYCRLVLQNVDSALLAFEEAYDLDPEKAETQYFLGLTHERSGRLEEARTFFRYALQNGFEPERAVREKLALLAREEEDYEEAALQYRAILALGGEETAEVYHALVTVLLEEQKNLDAAYALAREARDRLGDIPLVLDLIGWTEFVRGDKNQAAAYLTVAVEQDPSLGSAWYHKGLLAESVGDRDEALKSYREAYTHALGRDETLVKNAAEKYNALALGQSQ